MCSLQSISNSTASGVRQSSTCANQLPHRYLILSGAADAHRCSPLLCSRLCGIDGPWPCSAPHRSMQSSCGITARGPSIGAAAATAAAAGDVALPQARRDRAGRRHAHRHDGHGVRSLCRPKRVRTKHPAAHVRMYALHAAAVGAASNADPAVVRYVIGFEPNYPDFLLAQAPAHALNSTAQPCRLPGSWRSTARAAPHRSAWPQRHAHCAARKRQAR
jgi:hypothetical protein